MSRTEAVPVRGVQVQLAMLVLAVVVIAGAIVAFAQGAAAGQSRPPAAAQMSAGPQEDFRSRVRDEMADWTARMHDFDQRAAAGGKRGARASEAALRRAWHDTEVEARKVEAASALRWERTKLSYEAAASRMKKAWDKAGL